MNNMVEVHVRELARVGTLLDTALGAGANRVRIEPRSPVTGLWIVSPAWIMSRCLLRKGFS